MLKSWNEMRNIDVLPFCDQRDAKDDMGRAIKVPYLNWAKCKELLHKNGAETVYFEPCVNANGSSLFMSDQVFTDKNGVTNRCYEVRVKIVIDDLEFEAQFPLMNGSNPVKDNSLTQQRLWNAQTRAFVKGVAMRTGLGFGLWLDDSDIDSDTDDLSKEKCIHLMGNCTDTTMYGLPEDKQTYMPSSLKMGQEFIVPMTTGSCFRMVSGYEPGTWRQVRR